MESSERIKEIREGAAEHRDKARFGYVLATATVIAQAPVYSFVSHFWGDLLWSVFIGVLAYTGYQKIVQVGMNMYADALERW